MYRIPEFVQLKDTIAYAYGNCLSPDAKGDLSMVEADISDVLPITGKSRSKDSMICRQGSFLIMVS